MRILELFCGIGGAAAAVASLAPSAEIVAVDHDRDALATYAASFAHRTHTKNLARVPSSWFAAFEADLWWMSPPCQPHGIRGAQRDLDDPRSEAFLTVLRALREVRPRAVALENVPWFEGSEAHTRLRDVLAELGHEVVERVACPSHLGFPVERKRFYLVSAARLIPTPREIRPLTPLSAFVGDHDDPSLDVSPELRARFGAAFHVVDRDDPHAVAACFTAAYGRSPVYCGSYLNDRGRLRRFAPEEITALHGFPARFRFAEGLPAKRRYTQAGHSLPVPCVRELLRALPDFAA